ncbi:MAG: ester cyclase [Anaerolineae bacterium]
MSAEQIVRDFLSDYETYGVDEVDPYMADNLIFRQPGLPDGGKEDFKGVGRVIKMALPDWKWNVQSIATNGNQVTVLMHWTGTHTGTFLLSRMIAGMPDMPASGKKVSAPDKFVFGITGDKISLVEIHEVANGGLPAMLAQLGIALPQ